MTSELIAIQMSPKHNPQPLPIGRAIIHRATGRLAGPVAPIYSEDWPYQDVGTGELLWRYLDLYKFEDLLTTSTLYFARPDTFIDPFEGRLSTGNATTISRSEAAFRSLYKISQQNTSPKPYHDVHRQVVFILCWHRNTRESAEMWQAYTESSDSVVITTSGRALYKFLPSNLIRSAVKYHDDQFPRTEFDHSSLFFYKPMEYSFEREFRILRNPSCDEQFFPDDPNDKYRRLAVRLKKIIHRVTTHPKATNAFKQKVENLLRIHLPGVRRADSALLC